MNKKLKVIGGGIFILFLFILISYLLQINTIYFEENLNEGILGIFIYILIVIFATVVAPVSAIPLLPVAVFLWGWTYAALLSIIGWTIGSIIAFILARRYGVKLVQSFVSLDKINYYESFIPKKDLFLGIILIRIVLPVDVLSYALGIFSKVDLLTYSIATFVGVIPFAFILSYIGSLPMYYQLFSFTLGGLVLLVYYYHYIKKNKKKLLII